MTVTSWRDVPVGIAVHWHCLATVEDSADPKRWTDASTTAPDLVAWQPAQVLPWVRDQLIAHHDTVEDNHGRREWLEHALDIYRDADELQPPEHGEIPDRWTQLANTLRLGRWAMPVFGLGGRRHLVMQILSFADPGQPAGNYALCRAHERPAEQPYRGETP